MHGGVLGLDLAAVGAVPAPASGVQLGVGAAGRPVALRLFRAGGVRVALATELLPVQLIVVRAAAAGTPVQVVTARPQSWEPLLRHDRALHLVAATETRHGVGGPALLVDDRPAGVPRGAAELHPWQCRIDVRSQWMPNEIGGFARADLTLFGRVPVEVTAALGSAFAVPQAAAAALARLDPTTFGAARRGRIEFVTLDPTRDEAALLDAVRVRG